MLASMFAGQARNYLASSILLSLALSAPAFAAPTSYPLTLENCGVEVTFDKAPERAVALGQNSAEIMLMLGLEDRMVGTAFWPTKVLPELAEANEKVKLLTVESPSLEAILAEQPDFVAAQLPILLGPDSKVAKRDDLNNLGIGNYLAPGICNTRQDTGDAYGSRDALWNMDLLYQEIDELSQIFDVADRGQAVIAQFKAREAALRARVAGGDADPSFVFWFSSPSPSDDAYLGGKNGASGYIADLLGGHNAITTEAEWPTVSWEGIMAANPTVLVIASLDRNRWELDNAETKRAFVTTDPVVSQLQAVREGRIAVMNGAAMNPTIRTIYGAEELAGQLEAFGLIK
ncbi:ABC transporter (Iron.B12.siderophore.hemin), periplasmic substrate-binding component [Devosia sp. LC5]|uniref:ABC transporter substrate-binding protein n=1 Tax=Devosia sp. LC5 TaxID=1502724 RepID=UPI0004E3534C|nr:ABC transporter substrate-binding protein [Devosia sp. LC5]KFC71276.1 ABC transporter (Iron.B12.siderophore.hemin), periplasmic substrate-binding component [Devosia sp. LC5]